ncbi:MAG TPA: hypothetical protein VNH18_00805 [Bryobacteraceae bacterium]|nr:hypothetical protein [Bryobacteraceae bacterium]
MLFAIVNAGFIYGVIWVFERKRRELQDFDFGKIAVIPPFVYLGLSLPVLVLGLGIWSSWVALVIFLITLFWMLWKNAKLSVARAASYSLIVLVLNLALMTLLTYKPS